MKTLKKLAIITVATIFSLILLFIGMWIYFASALEISKITDITQTVDIMDRNDVYVTGIYTNENRTKIEIDTLPDHVTDAFIAIEDERFYDHIGIDIRRIFGAAFSNLKSASINEGASTISQQLIKLSHLSSKKTISRKIKEVFLALELERRCTKDEILEMYLNYCYFGNGAYGIEAASKKYFGVNAKDLTIAQSAMLAGILKSPSHYAPHLKPENSLERRNLVLRQMKKNEFITELQYQSAKEEAVTLVETSDEVYPYGYYIDTVLFEAEQALDIDSEELLKEGYTIYTNMDINIQNSLENAVQISLPKNKQGEVPQSAMIVLTTKGEISGIVGGREHLARRGINRAMDVKRSPGSVIKPVLVYAPAYEQKDYTNTSFILDEKQSFNEYSPSNSGNKYYGWVTTKTALSKSLNIPAVKILNDVGINNAKYYCESVGIEFESDDNHLALALGGFSKGVTPLQITAAYQPFANGGYYYEPSSIRYIADREGNIVYKNDNRQTKALSEETAFLLTDILKEAVNSGTASKLNGLRINVAAKTGTSNIQNTSDSKDAWIVSYTTEYICTAWIGYDDGSALPSNISGGSYPAEMVKSFYNDIYSTKKPSDFPVPFGIKAIRLDKHILENNKKSVIASEFTPDNEVIVEYFTDATIPTEYSDKLPSGINNFSVQLDSAGYPVISFDTGNSNIKYTLLRIHRTGQIPVYQITGQNNTVRYVDTNVRDDEEYEYYVVAITDRHTTESERVKIRIKKSNDDYTTQINTTEKTTESKDFTSDSEAKPTKQTTINRTTSDTTVLTTISP